MSHSFLCCSFSRRTARADWTLYVLGKFVMAKLTKSWILLSGMGDSALKL